jgi:hypothetical protein
MECRLAGETEVLGENLPPAPLLSITISQMTRPGFEPGPQRWEWLYLYFYLTQCDVFSVLPLLTFIST